MKTLLLATVMMALSYSPLVAQDFGKGLAAAQSGDFSTALKEWLLLAQKGHTNAQYNLGVMYDEGHGVLQDNVEAVKWYQLAAEKGNTSAQYNLGVSYKKVKVCLRITQRLCTGIGWRQKKEILLLNII